MKTIIAEAGTVAGGYAMRIWNFVARIFGCLAMAFAGIALLVVGSCQWQKSQAKQNIRGRLPVQYQDGQFVFYQEKLNCPGYSYIFKLSPSAARRLRSSGRAVQSGALAPRLWGTEGAEGLRCLGGDHPYRKKPNDLKDHVNLPDTYLRRPDDDTYDYFVPSLGVIVGGNEPG